MRLIRGAFASALIFAASTASAYTAADVQAAMLQKADEASVIIADLEQQLLTASPSERVFIRQTINAETARMRQLISFSRVVLRYPENRLALIVARFDLAVSPS